MSSADEPQNKGHSAPPETLDTEPGRARKPQQPSGQAGAPQGKPQAEPGPPSQEQPQGKVAAQDLDPPHGFPPSDKEPTIEDLQDEISSLKDKLLRIAAESENVRKRAEREKIDAAKFGISKFARDMMTVADNFQRALQSVTEDVRQAGATVGNLIAGIEMTERELLTAFERNGIVTLDPAPGEKFDPNYHQAVAEVSSPGQPNGTVVQVTQIGYLLDRRLLRPAMVLVAKNAADMRGAGPASEEPPGSADPGSKINTTA